MTNPELDQVTLMLSFSLDLETSQVKTWGLVRANEHWGLSMQDSTNGTTDTTVIHWNGGVGVDVLKQDGVTTDHSVAFNLNVNVTSTTTGGGTRAAMTITSFPNVTVMF